MSIVIGALLWIAAITALCVIGAALGKLWG
jgi:hypothetical protein